MLAIKPGKRRLTLEKKQSTSVRIRSYSGPYSVRMRENTDQNISE